MLNKELYIESLVRLGEKMKEQNPARNQVFQKALLANPWFEEREIQRMIDSIVTQYLSSEKLLNWLEAYPTDGKANQNIGLIAAANIPLVAFHDLLCIWISGNSALLRCSERDKVLYVWILELLKSISHPFQTQIVDQIKNYDAIIATGSDQSSKQFIKYFSHVPHIIRSNRNSVAILTGSETESDLIELGADIFYYFGLGCRNVSKIFIPKSYEFHNLFESLENNYSYLNDNQRYKNNYDYRLALSLMNSNKFYQTKNAIFIEDSRLQSAISCIHFEYYENIGELNFKIIESENKIQCIVGNTKLENKTIYPFGKAQQPELDDYADGINSLHFLSILN